jgi:hypothetical protein
MPSNQFINISDAFLVLNMTGSTTTGRVLLRLTGINLSASREVTEASTYDNYAIIKRPANAYSWEISCDGIASSDTGESEFQNTNSGSTYVVNTYNALELLELIKTKTSSATIVYKLAANNFQKGNVIITSIELSSAVNEDVTFSLSLSGSGDLTKTTS